ncbi:MAG: HAMP domain-containing sensor histidine kinase [Bacteroidota bacterium]
MKLFTKYNRINITATIFIFLAGSVAFYFVLDYVLIRQLDASLNSERQEITEYVQAHQQLPEIQNTKEQWIIVAKTNQLETKTFTKNIPVYNKAENEQEYIRQLSFTINVNQQGYLVTVNKSETETEDLLKLIILVTISMVAMILLFNYLINRRLINSIWKPFYNTIHNINDYAAHQQALTLSKEPIDEINLLNESLNSMTERIHKDFFALRSFTENASHEMQTPLAIIRSKVESLYQYAEGKEQMMQQLLSIEDACLKLSKLHQSLLLLTKLENKQFVLNESIHLKSIFEQKIEERKELFEAKQINLQINASDFELSLHQHLAEILISNLLNNAIRNTANGGAISILLNYQSCSISNTASAGSLDTEKVFTRFYKASETGTGLGLSIIKEICQAAGYSISYQFNNQAHHFIIDFRL